MSPPSLKFFGVFSKRGFFLAPFLLDSDKGAFGKFFLPAAAFFAGMMLDAWETRFVLGWSGLSKNGLEAADVKELLGQFVEVVGTKAVGGSFNAVGSLPLGEQVDAELWDEALKLAYAPQLHDCFEPVAVAA